MEIRYGGVTNLTTKIRIFGCLNGRKNNRNFGKCFKMFRREKWLLFLCSFAKQSYELQSNPVCYVKICPILLSISAQRCFDLVYRAISSRMSKGDCTHLVLLGDQNKTESILVKIGTLSEK